MAPEHRWHCRRISRTLPCAVAARRSRNRFVMARTSNADSNRRFELPSADHLATTRLSVCPTSRGMGCILVDNFSPSLVRCGTAYFQQKSLIPRRLLFSFRQLLLWAPLNFGPANQRMCSMDDFARQEVQENLADSTRPARSDTAASDTSPSNPAHSDAGQIGRAHV